MAKQDNIEIDGIVTEALKGGRFKVEIKTADGSRFATCKPSGKMIQNNIRILERDRVTVELSPYDMTNGRITWRYRD